METTTQSQTLQEPKFVKISEVKIGVMIFFTSFFYVFYWFYKQWKQIKKTNENYKNIFPFFRALLYPIYSFSFIKAVQQEVDIQKAVNEDFEKHAADTAGLKMYPWLFLAAFPFLAVLMIFDLPGGASTGLAIMMIITQVRLQKAMTVTMPEETPNEKFKFGDLACLAALVILVIFMIFAMIVSKDYTCFVDNNKISGHTLTNNCVGLKLNFPIPAEDAPVYMQDDGSTVYQIHPIEENIFYAIFVKDTEHAELETATNAEEFINNLGYNGRFTLSDFRFKTFKGKKMACLKYTEKGEQIMYSCMFNQKGLLLEIFTSSTEENIDQRELDFFMNGLSFN
ncbi:hypothetical protein Dip510_002028 [Elusimicrobium posterum]|uniref:hypothetical protein n=1 Tax=Elusimicrobium posterum TaxID=3116653 RepID=UPI003C743FF4